MTRKYKIWGFDFLCCCILNKAPFQGNTYILSDTQQLGTFIREKLQQMQCEFSSIASNVKIDYKLVSCFDENSEDKLETFVRL